MIFQAIICTPIANTIKRDAKVGTELIFSIELRGIMKTVSEYHSKTTVDEWFISVLLLGLGTTALLGH